MAAAWHALSTPVEIGNRRFPAPGLVAAAAVGAALLAVVALTRWGGPQDEHAYWLAARRLLDGAPLYDPTAVQGTPYAYWYPPVLAQALVPVAAVLDTHTFSWAWTALLLACLWWLGGCSPLGGLALIAFLPVAVELWFRNVQLVLAVCIAGGLLGRPWLFALGAAIKVSPGLGILYLAARGRWRDAILTSLVAGALLAASVLLAPDLWREFIDVVLIGQGVSTGASILPVPFWVRALAAVLLTLGAARLRPSLGDPLVVVAIMVGSPTAYATGLALLAALAPVISRARRVDRSATLPEIPAATSASAG